jgi:hypothetical protein
MQTAQVESTQTAAAPPVESTQTAAAPQQPDSVPPLPDSAQQAGSVQQQTDSVPQLPVATYMLSEGTRKFTEQGEPRPPTSEMSVPSACAADGAAPEPPSAAPELEPERAAGQGDSAARQSIVASGRSSEPGCMDPEGGQGLPFVSFLHELEAEGVADLLRDEAPARFKGISGWMVHEDKVEEWKRRRQAWFMKGKDGRSLHTHTHTHTHHTHTHTHTHTLCVCLCVIEYTYHKTTFVDEDPLGGRVDKDNGIHPPLNTKP